MSKDRADDLRLGHLIISSEQAESKARNCAARIVSLVGYPVDLGVKYNGGRVGAAGGPEAVADMLPKIGALCNCELGVDLRDSGLFLTNLEQVPLIHGESDIFRIHEAQIDLVSRQLRLDYSPFVLSIGGGNDQSYCNGKAWIDYLKSKHEKVGQIAIINVDAHLDVRPLSDGGTLPHSGTPFRQLIEYCKAQQCPLKVIEFAAQGAQCSAEHVKYLEENGGEIYWLDYVQKCGAASLLTGILTRLKCDNVFFSFDIDSVRGSDCPGVSCPAVRGITAQDALDMCRVAGQAKNVTLMDISEFNPVIERDRTARLVCQMVYAFLLGYAARS